MRIAKNLIKVMLKFLESRSLFNNLSRAFATLANNMQPKQRTYQDAIEALNNLQTNSQYLKNAQSKPKPHTNLREVTKFLNRTGLPLEKLDTLPVIHVAGTNGKGSTCAYCENILRYHGYKTGFYSSPHLLDVRERIRINGRPISKTEFASNFWKIYDELDEQKDSPDDMPLYFRYLTILAFHIFLEHKVDVAIIEVGIGGEYDCTNVIRKTVVAGITPLDLDHTSLLGHSIESIAWNKGGIMKEGCLAFTVKQPERGFKVLLERSLEKKCPLTILEDNFKLDGRSKIPPFVQKTNASLALAISEAFIKRVHINNDKSKQFSFDIAKRALEEAYWPGRYEIKQFNNLRFFLDGAHTLESILVVVDWFKDNTYNHDTKKVLIFNLTGGRNADIFFKELLKLEFDTVIFIPNVGSKKDTADTVDFIFNANDQLKQCEEYKRKWKVIEDSSTKKTDKVEVFSSFANAMNFLNDENEYNVLVTGSIHLIGAALSVLDPTLNNTLID